MSVPLPPNPTVCPGPTPPLSLPHSTHHVATFLVFVHGMGWMHGGLPACTPSPVKLCYPRHSLASCTQCFSCLHWFLFQGPNTLPRPRAWPPSSLPACAPPLEPRCAYGEHDRGRQGGRHQAHCGPVVITGGCCHHQVRVSDPHTSQPHPNPNFAHPLTHRSTLRSRHAPAPANLRDEIGGTERGRGLTQGRGWGAVLPGSVAWSVGGVDSVEVLLLCRPCVTVCLLQCPDVPDRASCEEEWALLHYPPGALLL